MTAKTGLHGIKSVLNFRDAGGMPTSDGKKIKDRIIFRSASPDKINRKDVATLQQLNIRTIIDLRAPYERDKSFRKIEGIDTFSFPLDFEKTTRERLIPAIKSKNAMEQVTGIINTLYLDILDGSISTFRNVVNLLLDSSRTPLLIHCQAGKDRTGILCALIQIALDADAASIIKGYMESNDLIIPHYKRSLLIRNIFSLGFIPADRILFAITVREQYLASVLDRVMSHYGGIEGYLSQSGAVSSELAELKRKFVI